MRQSTLYLSLSYVELTSNILAPVFYLCNVVSWVRGRSPEACELRTERKKKGAPACVGEMLGLERTYNLSTPIIYLSILNSVNMVHSLTNHMYVDMHRSYVWYVPYHTFLLIGF
jgi:hypothetical protein